MLKLVTVVLSLLTISSAVAQSAPLSDQPTKEELALAETIHGQLDGNPQAADLMQLVQKDVTAEITSEAKSQNPPQDFNDYVDSDASFNKYISDLNVTNFDSSEKADFLVKVMKASLRYAVQKNARFIGQDYFSNENIASKKMIPLVDQMGKLSF